MTKLCLLLVCASCLVSELAWSQTTKLLPAPSPVDNPLKGLVPYSDAAVERFPHSLEFFYVSLRELMPGPSDFDWEPIDTELDKIAGRGCQAVFRVWIEYPGQESGLPTFLFDQGVHVTDWVNKLESPPKRQFTPDYEDERLVAAIESFIAELGKRYDQDVRVGFFTAGLLGEWGEWHTWPRDELFASKQTQTRVLNAYQRAFKTTPILLRYPAGADDSVHTSNAQLPFGYHDDSFAFATLSTGRSEDHWYYMNLLSKAGSPALAKWKTQPIGGEIRPEVWGKIFDDRPQAPDAQDFEQCVRQTHVTWLMDSGMFQRKQIDARTQNAAKFVRMMGYDFWVKQLTLEAISDEETRANVSIVNQGVAPFYRNWPVELAILDGSGKITKRLTTDWSLPSILPSDKPTEFSTMLPSASLKNGSKVLMRVAHPLPSGKPLKFANASQDRDVPDWLTLN